MRFKVESADSKFFHKFITLFLGITSYIYVDFIGRISVSEILAILLFPLYGLTEILKHYSSMMILPGFLLLFFALVVSDLYVDSSHMQYLRGWAMVFVGVVLFSVLLRNFVVCNECIYIFLISSAISFLLFSGYEFNLGMLSQNSNYFKTAYVLWLLPIVAILVNYLYGKSKTISLFFLLFSGSIFIYFDARSTGIALVISTLILTFHYKFKISIKLSRILLITSIAYLLYLIYVYLVVNDVVGLSNAQQIKKLTNYHNPFELLLIGRSTVFETVSNIQNSYIIGHGSWAVYSDGEIIPKHSMIFGAWLWAGFFGFLGMLFIYLGILTNFRKILKSCSKYLPILTIYFVIGTWDFLFSPIGHLRITYPFLIAISSALVIRQNKISNYKYYSKFSDKQTAIIQEVLRK